MGTIGLVRDAYFPERNLGTCPVSALYIQVACVAASVNASRLLRN